MRSFPCQIISKICFASISFSNPEEVLRHTSFHSLTISSLSIVSNPSNTKQDKLAIIDFPEKYCNLNTDWINLAFIANTWISSRYSVDISVDMTGPVSASLDMN